MQHRQMDPRVGGWGGGYAEGSCWQGGASSGRAACGLPVVVDIGVVGVGGVVGAGGVVGVAGGEGGIGGGVSSAGSSSKEATLAGRNVMGRKEWSAEEDRCVVVGSSWK